MTGLIVYLIKTYKKYISPLLGNLFGGSCRYYPTCSEYSIEAFNKYGLIKGSWMTLKRTSRCHPWSNSGYDPVS